MYIIKKTRMQIFPGCMSEFDRLICFLWCATPTARRSAVQSHCSALPMFQDGIHNSAMLFHLIRLHQMNLFFIPCMLNPSCLVIRRTIRSYIAYRRPFTQIAMHMLQQQPVVGARYGERCSSHHEQHNIIDHMCSFAFNFEYYL